jgi:phosphotransferase system enzyme I (PtsI)
MPDSPTIKGIAISMGLAVGTLHVIRANLASVPTWSVPEEDLPREFTRLVEALGSAAAELEERQVAVAREAGPKDAEIFSVHRMILQDPSALQDIERRIREDHINAEAAVFQLIEHYRQKLARLDGASVRDFASDVSDPWRRVLDHLLRRDRESIRQSGDQVILAAPELTPQVVTFLPRERILAVIAEHGGRFSHAAVLARSLSLPCVVGLPNLLARVEQGLVATVDGDRGTVQLRPSAADLSEFRERTAERAEHQARRLRYAPEPARTRDGQGLATQVNIESVRDFETFDVRHCDGVGLLRTEFLYMERSQFPSEEEQYQLYRTVLERMGSLPVTIRTLDIGGDKPLPYFKVPAEHNPALGWRGLRISLQWPDLLQVQLRALLRASTAGNLRILLPMVGSVEQIEQARAALERVRQQLTSQGHALAERVPLGVMIEVPSLLFCLDEVLELSDFVSVGTNDLVQYLLAVDRDNSWVARMYEPHHPAVIRALRRIATAARERGVEASVCGDIASDSVAAVLLLGMGFTGVSVAPQFLADIKFAVSHCTSDLAREAVAELLACRSSEAVRARLLDLRQRIYASGG